MWKTALAGFTMGVAALFGAGTGLAQADYADAGAYTVSTTTFDSGTVSEVRARTRIGVSAGLTLR